MCIYIYIYIISAERPALSRGPVPLRPRRSAAGGAVGILSFLLLCLIIFIRMVCFMIVLLCASYYLLLVYVFSLLGVIVSACVMCVLSCCCFLSTELRSATMFTCPSDGFFSPPIGWHYLSNATCLMRPHLLKENANSRKVHREARDGVVRGVDPQPEIHHL